MAVSPQGALLWLLWFQIVSVVFLSVSLSLICTQTPSCQGSFFETSLNISVFGSAYFDVTAPQYAGFCIFFFLAGVGYVLSFVLLNLAYTHVYTHKDDVGKIYGLPRRMGDGLKKLIVYSQYLVAVLVALAYVGIFFLGALSQWVFLLCMGSGVFLAAAGGGLQFIVCGTRMEAPNVGPPTNSKTVYP